MRRVRLRQALTARYLSRYSSHPPRLGAPRCQRSDYDDDPSSEPIVTGRAPGFSRDGSSLKAAGAPPRPLTARTLPLPSDRQRMGHASVRICN
jgi:hypothetical protein